jgi:uncharacterized protein YegJ (DUF2314 family)
MSPLNELISLVALFRRVPPLELGNLRARLSHAFGTEFSHNPNDRNAILVHEPDQIPILVGGRRFGLIRANERYTADTPRALERLSPFFYDLHKTHTGFIAVDTFEDYESLSEAATYRTIGTILAECVCEEFQIVYAPEFDRGTVQRLENARTLLRSKAPWRAAGVMCRPSLLVPPEHPRLVAATAIARQRWSEFVQALALPREATRPMVKAAFVTGDGAEQLWLHVTSLQGDRIDGIIDSEPRDQERLEKGSRVSIEAGKITDWSYVDPAGTHQGLFTDAVLLELDEESP